MLSKEEIETCKEEAKQNLNEIIKLIEPEINKNDNNVTAILDLKDLKSLSLVLEELNKLQKEKTILNKTYIDNIPEGQLIGINKLQYKEYLNLKDNSIPKQYIQEKIEGIEDKIQENSDEQGYWGNSSLLAQEEILRDLLEGK